MITARATIGTTSLNDVNLLGYVPGGVGAPEVTEGRAPKRAGEIVVDEQARRRRRRRGRDQRQARAGRRQDRRPPLQLRRPHGLHDARRRAEPLVRRAAARQRGRSPRDVPRERLDGLERAHERPRSRPICSDRRRAASSRSTSSRCCCGSSPPGIIALIVYLTALERVRDFAVLKATGTSNATLFGALALQAVVLSLVSAVVAIAIAQAARAVLPVPDRDRRVGVRAARSRGGRGRSRGEPRRSPARHRRRSRARVRGCVMHATSGCATSPWSSRAAATRCGRSTRSTSTSSTRRARVAARRERLRQDDAALDAGAAADAHERHDHVRRHRRHRPVRPGARRLPAQDGRHRLPGVQPDPEPHRARERPDRGAVGQGPAGETPRRAPKRCSSRSGSRTG